MEDASVLGMPLFPPPGLPTPPWQIGIEKITAFL
jgi:hypothetical protein